MKREANSLQFYGDDGVARRFERRRGFAPWRTEKLHQVALDLLLALAPRGASLLELGAGTGHFTKIIVETGHFGRIHVTDGAAAMLEIAREKLAESASALDFELVDFSGDWSQRFAPQRFDVVTSTMALHHAEDKVRLFRQVFKVLKPGGIFALGDHMAASSDLGNYLIGRERALVVLGREAGLDHERIREQIELDNHRGEVEGNLCESVLRYLEALSAAGFQDVDCIWQDYWLAVLVARKSRSG